MSSVADLITAGMHPSEATSVDRDDAIQLIRVALKRRSGKAWSVTGGRGTAWGWITIQAPPSRRVSSDGTRKGDGTDWYMSDSDRAELGVLLGLGQPVHCQGESIAASSEYRREYIARAKGLPVLDHGTPYWD